MCACARVFWGVVYRCLSPPCAPGCALGLRPQIDYIRVYQRPDAINVGCSPLGYPTEQYIACNRHRFALTPEEQALIPQACRASRACRQEWGVDLRGGDLPTGDGHNMTLRAATADICCAACRGLPACGAYTWDPTSGGGACYLKAGAGWSREPAPALLSGVMLDQGGV